MEQKNNMTTVLEYKLFPRKNATKHQKFYRLESYEVKNGLWYRILCAIPVLRYATHKSYRSKEEAYKIFNEQIALEEWRSNKVNRID